MKLNSQHPGLAGAGATEEAKLRPARLPKQGRLEEMALFLTLLLEGPRALRMSLMRLGLEKVSIRECV